MKLWTVRRDETIAFIRNAVIPGMVAGRNELVADLLQYKYPIDQPTSLAMAQGGYDHWYERIGNVVSTRRAQRRALIAIRFRILNAPAVGAVAAIVNTIPDHGLQAALLAGVNAAWQAEQNLLTAALNQLTATPLAFMAARPLRVQGLPLSGSGNWVFYYDHANTEYRFVPPAALVGGEMFIPGIIGTPQQRVPFVRQQLYHVRVQPRIGILNLQAIPGDDIQHDTIVITEQLTGCSFMYQTNGVNMTAIHILPDPNAVPYLLATELRGLPPPGGIGAAPPAAAFLGGVAAGGVTNVFGAVAGAGPHAPAAPPPPNAMDYDYVNHLTHVVGVLQGGAWHVYAQARARRAMPAHIVDHWQVS